MLSINKLLCILICLLVTNNVYSKSYLEELGEKWEQKKKSIIDNNEKESKIYYDFKNKELEEFTRATRGCVRYVNPNHIDEVVYVCNKEIRSTTNIKTVPVYQGKVITSKKVSTTIIHK